MLPSDSSPSAQSSSEPNLGQCRDQESRQRHGLMKGQEQRKIGGTQDARHANHLWVPGRFQLAPDCRCQSFRKTAWAGTCRLINCHWQSHGCRGLRLQESASEKPRLRLTRDFTRMHLQLYLQNPASLAAAWAPMASALFSVWSLALEAQCSQPQIVPQTNQTTHPQTLCSHGPSMKGQASTSCIVAEACSPVLIMARGLVCTWATLTFAFTCRKSSQSSKTCQGHAALKSTFSVPRPWPHEQQHQPRKNSEGSRISLWQL